MLKDDSMPLLSADNDANYYRNAEYSYLLLKFDLPSLTDKNRANYKKELCYNFITDMRLKHAKDYLKSISLKKTNHPNH